MAVSINNKNGTTTKVATNVNIVKQPANHFMTKAVYDPDGEVAQAGGIPEYVEGEIADVESQISELPTASAANLGKIYQYVGTTTASYTKGYFYECVSDGAVTPTYSWVEKNVQSGDGEVDSDDVKIPSGLTELFNINHTTVDSWLSTYVTFADGVLTEKAHPTGTIGAHYQIADADLVDYDLRAKIKVNVVSVSGEWTCCLEYQRYDGTKASWAIPFGTITQAGEIVLEIDLANLSVYNNYAGGGVDFRVMNVSHGENDTVVINAIDTLVGKELDLCGDNVTEVLETLSTGLDDVSVDVTNIKSKGLSLPAPNGNMFKIEVANDGTLATALDYPDNILYIGNSLLLGFGTHGMASTTVNDDYYAKLNAFIESKGIILTTDRVLANDFEGATDDTSAQTWITNNLASKMSSNVKMVLIQLGDNVNTYQQREQFPSSMELLVSYLRQNCPNAKIAWVGCWYSGSSIDNVLIPNCRALDVPFVSIDGLFSVEENQSYIGATYIDASGNEKTITTAGQASHPSDQGFTAITNRIIEDLFTADSSTRGAESSRKSTVVRVSALPTASADFLNQTYLLTSPQTGYTEGGIYKCVAKGTNPETYEWKMMDGYVPKAELGNAVIYPPVAVDGTYQFKSGAGSTVTEKTDGTVDFANDGTTLGIPFFEVAINQKCINTIKFDYTRISGEFTNGIIYINKIGTGYIPVKSGITLPAATEYEIELTPEWLVQKGLDSTIYIGLGTWSECSYNLGISNTYGIEDTVLDLNFKVRERSLEGKKAIFLGDSITAFTDNRSWVEKFLEITGCSKIVNVAVPSARLYDYDDTVYDGDPKASVEHNNVLGNQVQKIINNAYGTPDLIVIAIGTNGGITADTTRISAAYYDNGSVPSLASLDKTYSEGAFRYCNETLHNLYPSAVIVWCNPIQAATTSREIGLINAYGDALKTLTQWGAVNNVETNRCGIMSANETGQHEYLSDGLHPNEAGAMKMAKYNSAAISKLFI